MGQTIAAVAVLAGLVAAPMAHARDVAPPAAQQEESGTVFLPGIGPNAGQGCWAGLARRAYIFSQGSTSGPFGSVIEVDEATWNGKFKLEVTSGARGTEDLDATFYIDMGSLDPADPAQQTVSEAAVYQTREPGGEAGIVPEGSKHALFCLVIESGANAGWTYEAAPPKKAKKKKR